jgi:hypothetical protein
MEGVYKTTWSICFGVRWRSCTHIAYTGFIFPRVKDGYSYLFFFFDYDGYSYLFEDFVDLIDDGKFNYY